MNPTAFDPSKHFDPKRLITEPLFDKLTQSNLSRAYDLMKLGNAVKLTLIRRPLAFLAAGTALLLLGTKLNYPLVTIAAGILSAFFLYRLIFTAVLFNRNIPRANAHLKAILTLIVLEKGNGMGWDSFFAAHLENWNPEETEVRISALGSGLIPPGG